MPPGITRTTLRTLADQIWRARLNNELNDSNAMKESVLFETQGRLKSHTLRSQPQNCAFSSDVPTCCPGVEIQGKSGQDCAGGTFIPFSTAGRAAFAANQRLQLAPAPTMSALALLMISKPTETQG